MVGTGVFTSLGFQVLGIHSVFALLLLWVIGGVSPLVVPNSMMVTAQRYIHIVEILTQNFPLGITAVLLLRPRRASISKYVAPQTV